MSSGLLVPVLVVLACASAPIPPGRSAILPASAAERTLKLCSRSRPADVDGSWEVPESVVRLLEADLPKLSRLKASGCCYVGGRVRDPGSYYRQYVGVLVRGRKLIYINAYRNVEGPGLTIVPVGVCDGGDAYWGALYDPESRRFSDLAINGSA